MDSALEPIDSTIPDPVRKHLDLLPGVPLVDSPFYASIEASGWFDAQECRLARELREQGYTVFDFDDPELPARAARIRDAMTPLFDDAVQGGERFDGRLMPPRFQDAWRCSTTSGTNSWPPTARRGPNSARAWGRR